MITYLCMYLRIIYVGEGCESVYEARGAKHENESRLTR